MKRLILMVFLLFFVFSKETFAIYNPQDVPNNKYGIHILEQTDIEDAAKLVNSEGGRWGYVTFVIRDDQRHVEQWIPFFKELRKKHLIPIVRLATHVEDISWVKPNNDSVGEWTSFLDNLPWPTNNRYVILFNEPNHAKEWGNSINPKEYAEISSDFIKKLKIKSQEFYILNAGIDLSAGNIPGETIDAIWYFNEMERAIPGILSAYDGWNSHSYPNPGFSASPYKIGRSSIVGYKFEQEYLNKNFNVPIRPVFITETGWMIGRNSLDESTVANYYKIAFEEIWTDENIIAITPFLLNYPESLFASFSWKDSQGNVKAQYGQVAGISKEEGRPLLSPFTFFGKLLKKFKEPEQKLTQIPEPLF